MNFHAQIKSADGTYSNTMQSQILSVLSYPRMPSWQSASIAVGLWFVMMPTVWGQATNQLPLADDVLTNLSQIWGVPKEHNDEEYRIRTEVLIYFVDAEWGNAAGECMGIPEWLPMDTAPIALKAGQRIAIDGVIIPLRQRFVWDKTKIQILEENVALKPEKVSDSSKNPHELSQHLISVEGLIDNKLDERTHCTINFLSGSTLARAYVLKGTNN